MEDEKLRLELQRLVVTTNPAAVRTMKRFAAAAATLVAGRPGREMRAPAPLVQVGFEPDRDDMDLIVARAKADGRDVLHVSCHPDGSGRATGMIAVVYFEGGRAWPHRRAGLVCAPGASKVMLAGVSDEEDERCHFVIRPDGKMVRIAGYPVENLAAGIDRAGGLWHGLVNGGWLGDCDGERLTLYSLAGLGAGATSSTSSL